MSKSLLLMFCLVIGLLVLACSKSADTNRNVAAPGGTNSSAPTNSSASAGDKIGIEECDSFLAAYENCVTSKVPEAGRAEYRKAITTWRTEWKRLAGNPQTRGTLAAACKSTMESARTQVKALGCTL